MEAITIENKEYKNRFESILSDYRILFGFVKEFPVTKNFRDLERGLNENSRCNLKSAEEYFQSLVAPMVDRIKKYQKNYSA